MELWNEVQRRVLTGELSKRQARKAYHLHWDTLQKILQHEEPPDYRKREPREKPVLGPFVALIHEIFEADKKAPPKQRHTAKRVLERLCEKGYRGGRTVVQEEVRRWKQHSTEVFMPLVHRPGEAQVDFGEAQPSLNRLLVVELLRCAYIDNRESVILIGNPGTGKTHIATALAVEACGRGKRVRFWKVTELITHLIEAREERQLTRMKSQLERISLGCSVSALEKRGEFARLHATCPCDSHWPNWTS